MTCSLISSFVLVFVLTHTHTHTVRIEKWLRHASKLGLVKQKLPDFFSIARFTGLPESIFSSDVYAFFLSCLLISFDLRRFLLCSDVGTTVCFLSKKFQTRCLDAKAPLKSLIDAGSL